MAHSSTYTTLVYKRGANESDKFCWDEFVQFPKKPLEI